MGLLFHNSTSTVAYNISTTTPTTLAMSNYTTTSTAVVTTRLCRDGTVTCDCAGNTTRGMLSEEGSLDALLYIVVVLLFYAFSIVVLMVKYIRRENKEAYLRQYFDDFVAREHFQSAQARNQICLKKVFDKRSDLLVQGHNNLSKTQSLPENRDTELCIPETINELVEDEEEEEVDFESAEDELHDEVDHTDIDIENEQVSSLEELLPRQVTAV